MFLTVHGAVGMIIGGQIGHPVWSFVISFIAHFLFDAIPHDPIELENWYDRGHKKIKFMLIGAIDLLILTMIVLALDINNIIEITPGLIAGLAGGLVPDFIWAGFEALNIKNKLVNGYKQFHEWTHQIFYKPVFVRWWVTTTVQGGILAGGLVLIKYLAKQPHPLPLS